MNTIVDAYEETYFAKPFGLNAFAGWENCGSEQSNICSWSVPASDVEQYWGQRVAPMIARFEPIEEHGLAGLWVGSYTVNDNAETQDLICQISGTLIMACRLSPGSEGELTGITLGNLSAMQERRSQYSGRIYSPPWLLDDSSSEVIQGFQTTLDIECTELDCSTIVTRINSTDGANSLTLNLTRDDDLSATDTSFTALAGEYTMTDAVGEEARLRVFEFIAPSFNSRQCRRGFAQDQSEIQSTQDGINVFHMQLVVRCGDTQFNTFGLVSLFNANATTEFSGQALFTGVTHNRQFTRAQSAFEIAREGTAQANSVLGEFDASMAIDGSTSSSWFSTGPGIDEAVYTWSGVQGDFITSITLVGNGENSDPEARLGVGFGAVRVEVLNDGQIVASTLRGMGGTPDPDTLAELNVFGDQIRLTFKGHEDISRGGFSELRINALR
ncbi:MAG: hypothetical protein AB8B86_02355 [Pseudomonadales bacterium]